MLGRGARMRERMCVEKKEWGARKIPAWLETRWASVVLISRNLGAGYSVGVGGYQAMRPWGQISSWSGEKSLKTGCSTIVLIGGWTGVLKREWGAPGGGKS